ncbi:MAG TPA: hypothetical protein PLJ94_06885 [Methylotenera sp.]|nr:hypothetical protein [Methylotenera sp.]HPH08388.1 hypothetical protein [Methylotenera sp.]HPM48663.1 hypothetical protein [Methylotenera sp.]
MSEVRIKRTKFTKVLQEICAILDQQPIKTVTWQSHFNDDTFTAEVEVLALWVAGSYARGALTCGDLDLVMDYRALGQARTPSMQHVKRAFFKNYSRVGIFEGTPTENDSGIDLQGAVLVWQGQGFDWQAAISSIKEDPLAGHHPRVTDAIPLRPLQLGMQVKTLEKLVEMKAQGRIDWQFTPISALTLNPPELEDEVYFERMMSRGGVKTQKLFPYLLAYFKQQSLSSGMVLRHHYDKTRYAVNGAQAFVGSPIVLVKLLDEITTSELVIMPHISARGPNGIWSIRRGAKHLLTLAFANISGYCYKDDEHGKPLILTLSKRELRPDWACARVIELFSSVAEAKVYAKNLIEDEVDDSEIMQIDGQTILDLISYADVVSINGDAHAITPTGCHMLIDTEISSTAELIDNLTILRK